MPNVGIAKMQVELRDSTSVVTQQYGQAPLQVHRPLYLEGANYPTVFLRSPSAGLLGGDSHELSIEVGDGATLEVRTQSAMLIYPGASRQSINIKLGKNAALRFFPHRLILAANADFEQAVQIELTPSSVLHYSDHWCAGRISMGEKWRFEKFTNTVSIEVENKAAYREHWSLAPGELNPARTLICAEYTHMQTVYEFGRPCENLVLNRTQHDKLWKMERNGNTITRHIYTNEDLYGDARTVG